MSTMTVGQSNLATEIIGKVVASLPDRSFLAIQDAMKSEAIRRAIPMLREMPAMHVQEPPPGLAEFLSPSQLKQFIDCSAKWWYRHGLNLPDVRTSFLGLGTAIHAGLGANAQQKIASKMDLPIGEVLGLYDAEWANQKDVVVFDDAEDPQELGDMGAKLTRKYMEDVAPAVHPAAVELLVEGEVGGVKVLGRVDLVEEDGAIRDTKSAAKSPSKIDPSYRMQVATYVPLTPGASGAVNLDYLVKNKSPKIVSQSWRVTGSDLHQIGEMYPLAQAMMRSGYYLPNRGSFTCSRKMCPYWRQCETEYGGEVAGA